MCDSGRLHAYTTTSPRCRFQNTMDENSIDFHANSSERQRDNNESTFSLQHYNVTMDINYFCASTEYVELTSAMSVRLGRTNLPETKTETLLRIYNCVWCAACRVVHKACFALQRASDTWRPIHTLRGQSRKLESDRKIWCALPFID